MFPVRTRYVHRHMYRHARVFPPWMNSIVRYRTKRPLTEKHTHTHTHTHTHRRRMAHTHTPSQTRTHMHALDHAGLTAPQYYCPEREHARAREEHLERHGHAQAHRLAVTHLITQSPQLLIILLQCQPALAHATSLDVSPHLVQSDRPPFMYVCMHVRMFVCIVRTYVFEMCSLSIYVCI